MKNYIEYISIDGFKSIKGLSYFKLNPGMNVLIGANGVGKSNFVELFKFIEKAALNGLNEYVLQMGGGEAFLYQGPETATKIKVSIHLSGQTSASYDFTFTPINNPDYGTIFLMNSFGPLGSLPQPARLLPGDDPWAPLDLANEFLNEKAKGWRIYRFLDVSAFSPLRREASVHNDHELLPDGSNLSAILLSLKRNHAEIFETIRESARRIMPCFRDFVLEPKENQALNDAFVRLCWLQNGTRYLFQPWQMSEGSLRFLALAVALLQPNQPETIIIDEPENGLHPEALSTLASFMHEASLNAQLIVATQSPDLLNTMEPENVVTVNMRNGESIFQRLARSDFIDWINDYGVGDLWWKKVIQAGPTYA
jgi:predicted ATPase